MRKLLIPFLVLILLFAACGTPPLKPGETPPPPPPPPSQEELLGIIEKREAIKSLRASTPISSKYGIEDVTLLLSLQQMCFYSQGCVTTHEFLAGTAPLPGGYNYPSYLTRFDSEESVVQLEGGVYFRPGYRYLPGEEGSGRGQCLSSEVALGTSAMVTGQGIIIPLADDPETEHADYLYVSKLCLGIIQD